MLDVGEGGLGRVEGMCSGLLNSDDVSSKRLLVKSLGVLDVTEPQHSGIIILGV